LKKQTSYLFTTTPQQQTVGIARRITPYHRFRRRLPCEKIRRKSTGKELDRETGLYYFGARYLDPRTSRWLSVDPAIWQGDFLPSAPNSEQARRRNSNLPNGGVFNPINLHVFNYSNNNPIRFVDPDGRSPVEHQVLSLSSNTVTTDGMSVRSQSSIIITPDNVLRATDVQIISFDYSISGQRAAGEFMAGMRQNIQDSFDTIGGAALLVGAAGLAISSGIIGAISFGASILSFGLGRSSRMLDVPEIGAGDTVFITDRVTQQTDAGGNLLGMPSRSSEISIYDRDHNLRTQQTLDF